jgi:hypothetical protein
MHVVNGSPVIYLLPARTPANKFCKPTKKDSGRVPIHLLENWLISLSLQKNSKLIPDFPLGLSAAHQSV